MNEKIDDSDFWKAQALASSVELAKARFEAHVMAINVKYKVREGVDAVQPDGTIVRGEVK